MNAKEPTIFEMARAPFLSSILSPLLAGTLLAIIITGKFDIINFILLLLIGVGLHAATNVYNDIYDTLQGTDRINKNRNEFSGGSGIIINFPHLMPRMYKLAHQSLVLALIGTIILTFRIDRELRWILWGLYLLSAFFSKYYTAAPVKLAYRGLGEISVWFAFGPMAILIAAVSQNVSFDPLIVSAMPITGISTLSILLIGQMIDYEADKGAGKWGIVVRAGFKTSIVFYGFIQIFLVLNIIVISVFMIQNGWFVLLSLIPYVLIFPKLLISLSKNMTDNEVLKKVAGMNVQIHLLLFILMNVGLLITVLYSILK